MERARPLERALFAQHFEGGDVLAVFDELARFQNDDGGFGQALEPDVRTPSSSALATGIALRMLSELNCPAQEDMVRRAVAYLLHTFDVADRVWRVVPLDTNACPHAPWWYDEGGSLQQLFDGFLIIPRALIVGSLVHYSELVPGGLLEELIDDTVRAIETEESLGEGGGSDLEYAIYLAESRGLPPHQRTRLVKRILEAIRAAVVSDSARWGGYCLSPLRAVRSPQALGAELIRDDLQRHLDYQIEQQTEEGTWEPSWSWGGSDPEAWEQARIEWRGMLTLDTLTQLRAFGRLALG